MTFISNNPLRQACRRAIIAGGLAVSFVAFDTAIADVTGVFQTGGAEGVTIEYRDDDHVRMRTADGGYIVITGGEGYMVSREGGEWVVYAMEDFRAMFQNMGIGGPDGVDFTAMMNEDDGVYELRDTGRTENIAGISGRVHEVVMSDGWNEEVSGEVVLTDDGDAMAVYRGMLRITRVMGEMAGQQGLDRLMGGMYGIQDRAILRADEGWQLASIERNAIPDNAFTLPAEPTEIEGMPALFGGDEGEAAEIGAAIGGWLGGLADEMGGAAGDEARSVSEEAESEARDDVEDNVRDRVRRGMRGLFNR